jgi:isoquinoline 1-oxidoreductase alpha subunit
MSEITLRINGSQHTIDVPENMPLLWALRDVLNLTGTKYGCGIGACGVCTILFNGVATRSCLISAVAATGSEIVTIEGLEPTGMHPVQRAWNDEDVPQCGYCQGGQILSATALLSRTPQPSDGEIDDAMSGVLCRCGTYPRIRKAVKRAAEYMAKQGDLA